MKNRQKRVSALPLADLDDTHSRSRSSQLMQMAGGVLEQYDIEPAVEQLGASSSSKPEDTQLTVEKAKEVFTRGRGRPVSVITIPDEMLAVLIDRNYAGDKTDYYKKILQLYVK